MRALLQANPGQVAAIIVEPVVGNAGVLLPAEGFLQGLAAAAQEAGALLIADEVMTGFRLAWGGAQELYGLKPDLTTLGKIIGGGLPCAAYGGRARSWSKSRRSGRSIRPARFPAILWPWRPAWPRCSNSASPALMRSWKKSPQTVCRALLDAAAAAGWRERVCLNRAGSMFTLFFCPGPVQDFAAAKRADAGLYARFFRLMLEHGVYLPPSQFEAAFVNLAMDRKILKRVSQGRPRRIRILIWPKDEDQRLHVFAF